MSIHSEIRDKFSSDLFLKDGKPLSGKKSKASIRQQEAIDYGFRFAKNYFLGQVLALLSGKSEISEQTLREVREVFK